MVESASKTGGCIIQQRERRIRVHSQLCESMPCRKDEQEGPNIRVEGLREQALKAWSNALDRLAFFLEMWPKIHVTHLEDIFIVLSSKLLCLWYVGCKLSNSRLSKKWNLPKGGKEIVLKEGIYNHYWLTGGLAHAPRLHQHWLQSGPGGWKQPSTRQAQTCGVDQWQVTERHQNHMVIKIG